MYTERERERERERVEERESGEATVSSRDLQLLVTFFVLVTDLDSRHTHIPHWGRCGGRGWHHSSMLSVLSPAAAAANLDRVNVFGR
jgi:hypothetical protein